MSYTPKYTSETKVEAELQTDLSNSTKPTSAQVLVWIEEEEAYIDEIGLGQKTASNVTIDVPEELEMEAPPQGTISWFEWISYDYERWSRSGRKVCPELVPIVTMTSAYRRTSGLGDTEVWSSLTEGLANDYVVLQGRTRAGLRGYAFYFFDNLPSSGVQRVKATYTYGLGLATNLLSEYATWKVCVRVLFALSNTSSPTGTRQFVGGLQSYVPTQYAAKATQLAERILKWESEWVRKEPGVAVL